MCGITGIIKKKGKPITTSEFHDFLGMLVDAQARGRQATGVLYVFEDGSTFVLKSGVIADKAVDFIPFRRGLRAILGHTRASTGGVVTDSINNHPHESENWILIHNGTCDSSLTYNQLSCKGRCDTEKFIRTFEYNNKTNEYTDITKLVCESLGLMSGGWSLGFIHKPTGRLFLTTNGKNPLYCVNFGEGIMFGSSENYFTTSLKYTEHPNRFRLLKGKKKLKVIQGKAITKKWHTVYQPPAEVLYEVLDSGLKESGTYVTREYTYTSYSSGSSSRGGGYSGSYAPSADPAGDMGFGVDLDLLDEDDWRARVGIRTGTGAGSQAGKGKTEGKDGRGSVVELEDAINQKIHDHLVLHPPTFDCLSMQVSCDLEGITERQMFNFVCQVVVDQYQIFELTEQNANTMKINLKEGQWTRNLPYYYNSRIEKAFVGAFTSAFTDELDTLGYTSPPPFVWEVMDDDGNSLSEDVMKAVLLGFRILIAVFGVEFDNMSVDIQDASQDETEPKLEDYEDSPFGCDTCMVTRKRVVDDDGFVTHICPVCKGKLLVQDEPSTRGIH